MAAKSCQWKHDNPHMTLSQSITPNLTMINRCHISHKNLLADSLYWRHLTTFRELKNRTIKIR